MDAASVQIHSPRLSFLGSPSTKQVEGLFRLNSRHFSHVEPSSNCSGLGQGYSAAFGVTLVWIKSFGGSNGLTNSPFLC